MRPGDGVYDQYCARDTVCLARVGVYAFTPSFFSITAFSGNALLLPENVPIRGVLQKGDVDHFVYEYDGSDNAVVFTVTPLSGDVDLYIDNRDTNQLPGPGPGNSLWSSRGSRLRSEVIEIFPSDTNACRAGQSCRYYIGVAGDDNRAAAYSILVRTHDSQPTPLQPGQPQLMLINASKRAFFRLSLPPGDTGAVRVSVSPTFGDPDLYASWGNRTLTTAQSDYRSTKNSGDELITIKRSDAPAESCGAADVCQLTILVFGWTDSLFSIVASGDTPAGTELIDGQSVGGFALPNDYVYYNFQVTSTDTPAVFAVTGLTGNPDLFVATTPSPGPDTPGVHRSAGAGHESVVLSQTQLAKECTPAGRTVPNFPCAFFIGVLASSGQASSWRIVASSTPPTLSLGSPSTGAVDRGTLAYYTFHLPETLPRNAGPVTLSVTPTAGTTYAYVSAAQPRASAPVVFPRLTCGNGQDPPCLPGDGAVTDFAYSSATSLGAQTVTINDFVPGADYGVGVLAANTIGTPKTVEFAIVVSGPDSTRILSSGVPIDGTVQSGGWLYYKIMVTSPGVNVRVSLTPYTGDPDLYVSWHPEVPRPNLTNNDALSISRADETILITAAEWGAVCTVGQPLGHQCAVYIGVRGYPLATEDASFSLVAVANTSDPITLLDGQPQTGTLNKGEAALYAIPVQLTQSTDTFSIAVTPYDGDPDLYVRKGEAPGRAEGTYDHKSISNGGYELINIGPEDVTHCMSCTVYALVYGYQDNSPYQILYSSNGLVTELRDGKPQVVSGTKSETRYFVIRVPKGADSLTVDVTTIIGDADIYMSVETTPDVRPNPSTGATWVASEYRDDSITVADPSSFCPSALGSQGCNFIIGVYSFFDSRFTVAASLRANTVTQLTIGAPLQGRTSSSDYKYFYVVLPPASVPSARAVTISASTTIGAVDMFATYVWNPNARPGEAGNRLPGPQNYNYSTTDPDNRGGRDTISVVWLQDDHPVGNFLAIAVASRLLGSEAQFTISASESESITTLRLNSPTGRRPITFGEMQHFRVPIQDVSADVVVNVNMFSGSADVSIATQQVRPSCRLAARPGGTFGPVCSGVWEVSSGSSNSLRISHADPCASATNRTCDAARDFRAGDFYLGVFGVFAGEYTLTVQQLQPVELSDGSPATGVADANVPSVFSLRLTGQAAAHDVRFTISRTEARLLQASGATLAVYLSSCRADVCTDADQSPSAAHHDLSLLVEGGAASRNLIVGAGTAAHCAPSGPISCVYFISVTALCSRPGPSCPTDFSIIGASQGGSAVTYVDFSAVSQDLWQAQASVPDGSSAQYELFLQPDSGAARVQLNLEACGPGLPTLYVCDPVASEAGGKACVNPFAPSKNDHSFAARTSASGGKASVVIPSSRASRLYFAVDAAGSRRRLASPEAVGQPSPETFTVSASLNTTYYLVTPATGGVAAEAVADSTSVDVSIRWPAPLLQAGDARVAAKGATARVVMRSGGFGGTGAVVTTACGLSIVASRDGSVSRLTDPGVTSLTVGGLEPLTDYDANVVLTCGAACLQASLAGPEVREVRLADGSWAAAELHPGLAAAAAEATRRAGAHRRALAAPLGSAHRRRLLVEAGGQSASQSVAFASVASVTTAKASPPPEPKEGFPESAIIALSSIGGILALGGVGFFCYRRCRSGAFRSQYVAFSPSGAMDTLPEPADDYSAMFDE